MDDHERIARLEGLQKANAEAIDRMGKQLDGLQGQMRAFISRELATAKEAVEEVSAMQEFYGIAIPPEEKKC